VNVTTTRLPQPVIQAHGVRLRIYCFCIVGPHGSAGIWHGSAGILQRNPVYDGVMLFSKINLDPLEMLNYKFNPVLSEIANFA